MVKNIPIKVGYTNSAVIYSRKKIKITLRLMFAKAYTTISTFKIVLNYVHYIVKR